MKDFDLLAFGGGPINAKEAELIRQLGIAPENLRQLQGGDDVLEGLYRRAAAFVYPSLYEGLGPAAGGRHEAEGQDGGDGGTDSTTGRPA